MKMLRKLLMPSLTLVSMYSTAQNPQTNCTAGTAVDSIGGNNVSAIIRTNGSVFQDDGQAGFRVKGDDGIYRSTICASGLWLGAYDAGGNLRLAATRYDNTTDSDYFPGPLSLTTGATEATDCENFDRIWKVTRSDIWTVLNDIQYNGSVTGVVPQSLLEWPGRGNPHFEALVGFILPQQDLAPFYDYNGDAIYNPYDGDYPVFERGNPNAIAEEMTWNIFNDNGNVHGFSQGDPMQMEVQLITYTFSCGSESVLDNVLFVKYELRNYNALTLTDYRVGFWNDLDLGCGSDDYIGTDSTLNTMYAYNGDMNDDISCLGGALGFGDKPAVQAVTLLSHNLSKSMVTINGTGPVADASSAIGMYRILDGVWADGTVLSPEGFGYDPTSTDVANFIFPDYPTSPNVTSWSMASELLSPSDLRGTMSVHQDTLYPGTYEVYDLAYTYMRDTNMLGAYDMTNLVPMTIPQVQAIYDNGFSSVLCAQHPLLAMQAVRQNPASANVFPNPNSNGLVTVVLNGHAGDWHIDIFDVMGRMVVTQQIDGSNEVVIDVNDLEQGMYFYQISGENQALSSGKLIIE